MAKLIFLGEKFAGRVYEFAIERTTVGRGDHNTLTIQDASVSHSHCEILIYGVEVIVRDLGSSNGTVVDGRRLFDKEQRPLDQGQIVRFGLVEARLELSTESTSDSDTVTDWTAIHSHSRHLGDKPKPATTEITKPGTNAPVHDDHTLVVPAAPPVAAKPLPEPAVNPVAEKAGGNKGLILMIAAIGLGLVIFFWFFLAKYR